MAALAEREARFASAFRQIAVLDIRRPEKENLRRLVVTSFMSQAEGQGAANDEGKDSESDPPDQRGSEATRWWSIHMQQMMDERRASAASIMFEILFQEALRCHHAELEVVLNELGELEEPRDEAEADAARDESEVDDVEDSPHHKQKLKPF